MNKDLDFELKANGICLNGYEVSIDNSDANKVNVAAANEAAMRYKCELAACRRQYGSHRNIMRVIRMAEWECYTLPLVRAVEEVYAELEKLRRNHKPCDYVEKPNWYSITRDRIARRSYDEWERAFIEWCFKAPLNEDD